MFYQLSEDKYARCYTFKNDTICVGTKDEVQLISYKNPSELRWLSTHEKLNAYLVELVPERNWIIYVPEEARNTLKFYNYHRNEELREKWPLQYETNIVRIIATPTRILVATEKQINVYGVSLYELSLLRQIEIPGTLKENLVDLSLHPISSYIAYPDFNSIGSLCVAFCRDHENPPKDLPPGQQEPPKIIAAHDDEIAAIAVDPYGRTVASASQTGVLIKVHRTYNNDIIYEFRRGLTLGVSVTSLTFSPDSRFVFSQDTAGYLKVYKFGFNLSVSTKGTHWLLEKLQRLAEAVLPESTAELFFEGESFASIKLSDNDICKVTSTVYKGDSKNIPPHILIATPDGLVYTYLINIESGGPCTFLSCYSVKELEAVERPDNTWVML